MGIINDERNTIRIEGMCWNCEGKNGYIDLPIMRDKKTGQITRICEDAGGLKLLCDFCKKKEVSI